MREAFRIGWTKFWMRRAGLTRAGRLATRLAGWDIPPYKGRSQLAKLNPAGYVAPDASIYHFGLRLGAHVFIGERVVIYQAYSDGGVVELGDSAHIHCDSIIETGQGGSVTIGSNTHIQPRCQFSGYKGSIRIGDGVQIAPFCAFYPYDHRFAPGQLISSQAISTKGDIIIGDDAWLGVRVVVLNGAKIGKGAVIGAGSVVVDDIPDYAIAVGSPARVIKSRKDLVLEMKIEDGVERQS